MGRSAELTRPRVTVGLAVYNGAEHLEAAIEAHLAQTFTDFELVISDNASTDATEAICRKYAALDPRVIYRRNPVNIGAVRNETRTLLLARGEYFKLAGHDDLINDRYLEHCVALLDADPAADLCVPATVVIDGEGRLQHMTAPIAGLEARAADRMNGITDRRYMCEATYGVFRTSALRSIRLQANRTHSDRVTLAELALRRPFLHAPEAVIWRRAHAGNTFHDIRGRMVWFSPELQRTGAIRLPHWRHLADNAIMLGRAEVSPLTWCRCWPEVARVGVRYWRSLAKDLAVAATMAVGGRARRRARYRAAAGEGADDAAAPAVLLVSGPVAGPGGTEQIHRAAERLRATGHLVTVLVPGSGDAGTAEVADALRREGISVHQTRRPTGLARHLGTLGTVATTVATVLDSCADSVHLLPGSAGQLPYLQAIRRWALRHVDVVEVGPVETPLAAPSAGPIP